MVRVTKPGGKVLLISYGPPENIDSLKYFIKEVQYAVPGFKGLPNDPPPLEFQWADPSILAAHNALPNQKGQPSPLSIVLDSRSLYSAFSC